MNFLINNAELIGGLFTGAIILLLTIIFGAPLYISIPVGLTVFLGFWLIRSYRIDLLISQEAASMNSSHVMEKIKLGQKKLQNIRNISENITDNNIRSRILKICDTVEKIFSNFEQDETDIARASRFLLYLDRFLITVDQYANLSATEEGRELLSDEGHKEDFCDLLDVAEKAFKSGFKNYLENDAMEFRTVSRVLKKMMETAEIGR